MLDKIAQAGSAQDWLSMLHGIERENLRIDADCHLSKRSHFEALGVSPNDETFTLDFSESQLEIVTPPHTDITRLLNHLQQLTDQAYQKIMPETLWPSSMPPLFDVNEIQLARFGDRPEDQQKFLKKSSLLQDDASIFATLWAIDFTLWGLTHLFCTLFKTSDGLQFLKNRGSALVLWP